MKKLIPLSVRERFRPQYHSFKRKVRKEYQSRLWFEPQKWKEKRKKCDALSDTHALYTFAAEELGLIQVENEIVSFVDFVAQQNPKIVGEIGLKNGGNTLLFMRAWPAVKIMISLDILVHNEGRIRSLAKPDQKFYCLEGNTHSEKTFKKLERILNGEKFDLLFIDGDHSYVGVKQDHEQYAPLVREGGLIAFHDIVTDHRGNAETEPSSNCYAGGVHRYWAEIKNRHTHWEFVQSWDQNGFGIGLLRKEI